MAESKKKELNRLLEEGRRTGVLLPYELNIPQNFFKSLRRSMSASASDILDE